MTVIAEEPRARFGLSIERWSLLPLLLAYVGVLGAAYAWFVVPEFEYWGFYLNATVMKVTEALAFCLIAFLFVPVRPVGQESPSSAALQVFYLALIVPLSVLYGLADTPRECYYACMVGFAGSMAVVRCLPEVRLARISVPRGLVFLALGGLSAVTLLVLWYTRGWPSLVALRLLDVYEVRAENVGNPVLLQYLTSWQAKVIDCFLIGVAYYHRRWVVLGLVFAGHLYLYLSLAHKLFLVYPLVLVLLLYVARRWRLFPVLAMGLAAGVVAALLTFQHTDERLPASLLVRRALFVPAQNTYLYYKFYSDEDFLYLADSRVAQLFTGGALLRAPRTIGDDMMGRPGMHMNVGYLGDGYANFGVLGILAYSLVLGLVLKCFDAIGPRHSTLVATLAVVPMLSFIDSGLLTTLLTHGVLLNGLLLWAFFGAAERKSQGSAPSAGNGVESARA